MRQVYKSLFLNFNMASYDVFGNIAVVKFPKTFSNLQKKKYASDFLKKHQSVKTIVEKSDRIKGRLRTMKLKYLAGERNLECLYKENGCIFRLNVGSCYFSPRLASERKELAEMIKKDERVLVMFGGVAPYAVVFGKYSKASEIISVELGRECSKYALENVKRNKLVERVKIFQGDVRKVIGKGKKVEGYFDRIVMARPNLKDSFLDIAFKVIRANGIIHYYGFYDESKIDELKELIQKEAIRAKKKIKILRIKKAGDIGVRVWRWRVDFLVY